MCNFCSLQRLRDVTKDMEPPQSLTVAYEREWRGGATVYRHPPGVIIADLPVNERAKYWHAWFYELPARRECAAQQ